MKDIFRINSRAVLFVFILMFTPQLLRSQELIQNPELDRQVREFLDDKSYGWRDMNVPAVDGKKLYDIIIENRYTKALEIGTSTGHSGIWIAWALSKTGGKLITIDIDERRHKEAVENFKKAGLSKYIEARLADAHELVPRLKGPFDFVFSDADKYWYKNYFTAVDPNLEPGACYTTHNVSRRGRGGNLEYLNYLLELPNYETSVFDEGGGLAISYKKSAK